LRKLYLEGYGVEKEIDKAKELFEKASNQGNVWAARSLASIYMSGDFGIFKKFYGYYLMWISILRGAIIYSRNNLDERMLG